MTGVLDIESGCLEKIELVTLQLRVFFQITLLIL
jgi:hypothetical protein